MSRITEQVGALARPVVEEEGCTLWDVEYVREAGEWYLRIYIDKEGGMDLDGCEAYHRKIQPKVEDYDYDFLECCSPGADRPLKTDADFERSLGAEVEVRLFRAVDGVKEAQGILSAWTKEDFTLESPDGAERRFLRKDCASVRPTVDLTGVEDVEL